MMENDKWRAYKPEGSTGYWYIDKDAGFSGTACYGNDAEENARRLAASANQLAFLPLELLEDPEYSVENELKNIDAQIQARLKAEEKLEIALVVLNELTEKYAGGEIETVAREALRKIADA